MAKSRFGISKTEKEWATLEMLINSKRIGKPNQKGSGLSWFIHQEVMRLLKGKEIKCPHQRIDRHRKEFEITLPDELAEKLTCEANRLGISVGEYIEKKILDPHLESHPLS